MVTKLNFHHPAARGTPKPALQRVPFDKRFKAFRNKLRKFSLRSIIEATLALTSMPPDDVVQSLRMLPWLPMLIVKWALLDRMVHVDLGEQLTQEHLVSLVTELWNFEGDLLKQPMSSAHLLIRPRAFVQIQFQQKPTRSFVRIPALLSRLPVDHGLRRLFQSQWELSPEQFVDLAIALYGARMEGNTPGFSRAYFEPLAARYGTRAIDRMLEMLSQNIEGLRNELTRAEDRGGDRGVAQRRRSELFEFPYFKRFPLYRVSPGVYLVWHPIVLGRALDEAVHLRLSDAGKAYSDSFSKVFERYVVELATNAHSLIYTEQDIKSAQGSQSTAVEAIIPFEQCNVMIEAKMGLFPDEVITANAQEIVKHKLRDLRKAVTQGAKVAEMLDSGELVFNGIAQAKRNYLIVVTSRDLIVGRGEVLDAICPPGSIAYPSDLSKELLPLAHVFFVSIDGFEKIIAAVRVGLTNLPDLLVKAVKDNAVPGGGSYWLELQMSNIAQAVEDSGSLIETVWNESHARLAEALGDS